LTLEWLRGSVRELEGENPFQKNPQEGSLLSQIAKGTKKQRKFSSGRKLLREKLIRRGLAPLKKVGPAKESLKDVDVPLVAGKLKKKVRGLG